MGRKRPPIDAKPGGTPLGPEPTVTPAGKPLPLPKYVPSNPQGRPSYDKKALQSYRGLSLTKQGDALRRQWSVIAKILADKIERAAPSLTKKDWYYFKSLLVSGGVALDKAFPKIDTPTTNSLVINMFGSLGKDAISRVLNTEPIPVIDVTPIEISHTDQVHTTPQQKALTAIRVDDDNLE